MSEFLETILSKIDKTLADYEESKTAEPPQINGRTALMKVKDKE